MKKDACYFEAKPRVLIVAPSLSLESGVASHIMSYYRLIHAEIDIDFALYVKTSNKNTKEIKRNGSKIYYFKKALIGGRHEIKNFMKKNAKNYDIIHCHTFNYGLPYLYYAKKYGIQSRILHVHSIKYSDNNALKSSLNHVFIKGCKKIANVYIACSLKVGQKAFRNKTFSVVKNCIDISSFDDANRSNIRTKLNVQDGEFLFGNVGRLVKTKNHIFLVRVFKELKSNKKFKNGKLLIIGDGPEKEVLKKYIESNNLKESVVIKSDIENISDYYAAMDCFVFPSLYEGLGMVMVEAQASGLPCFCFNNMPKEVFASKLVHGLEVGSDEKTWCETMTATDLHRTNVKKNLRKAGFDIKTESKNLIQFYYGLANKGATCV